MAMPIGEVRIRASVEDGAEVLHQVFPQLPARDDAVVWDSFTAMSEYCQTLPDSAGIEASKGGYGEHGIVLIHDRANVTFFRGTSEEARALTPGFIVRFSGNDGVQRLAETLVEIAKARGFDVHTNEVVAERPYVNRNRDIQDVFNQNSDMSVADIAARVGVTASRVRQVIGSQLRKRKETKRLVRNATVEAAENAEANRLEVPQLDQMIRDMEKELAALKAIREVSGGPEVISRLLSHLTHKSPTEARPQSRPARKTRNGLTVDKMQGFLESRHNQPATYQEIADAIGCSKQSVQLIAHERHKDRFVKSDTNPRVVSLANYKAKTS